MKVKEVLKKFMPVRSNCDVFVQDGLFGDLTELKKEDQKNLSPDYIMEMRVNALTIVARIVTRKEIAY